MLTQINEVIGYARWLESIWPISDEDLAQAIIIALPPSYETLVTVLTGNKSTTNLSSFNVISAVVEHKSHNKETAKKALCAQAHAAHHLCRIHQGVEQAKEGVHQPKLPPKEWPHN